MNRAFIMTPIFDKLWDDLSLTDNDLNELQNFILKNNIPGDTIKGTNGAIKLRWNLKPKGKRGGIRVIYTDVKSKFQTHLLLCYPKSKQDDLTEKQKQQLKTIITEIKGEL